MSGNGRGVERGGVGDDGGARRAIWTEDRRWRLTAAVDNESGGHSMAVGAFYVGNDGRLQGGTSNEGGGGLRTPSNAFRRVKRRWWGVRGMLVMAPLAGLWECSVVGAAAVVVHLWGAGGSALLLEGRRRRLPTRRRPHWSRAFNNAGNGTSALRGGGGAKRCDVTTSWREQR